MSSFDYREKMNIFEPLKLYQIKWKHDFSTHIDNPQTLEKHTHFFISQTYELIFEYGNELFLKGIHESMSIYLICIKNKCLNVICSCCTDLCSTSTWINFLPCNFAQITNEYNLKFILHFNFIWIDLNPLLTVELQNYKRSIIIQIIMDYILGNGYC